MHTRPVALALALVALVSPGPARAAGPADVPGAIDVPSAIVPGTVNRTSLRIAASYDVTASLRIEARRLTGTVTIEAVNESGTGIDRLELNTTLGALGGLALGAVTVDGKAVAARAAGQTILVPLGGILPAGATATVRVPFAATLRSDIAGSNWLLTRANGIVSMYRWVPWISRATTFRRPNHGDPFVTPVATAATLRLTVDAPTRVVVNGTRTATSPDGLTTTWHADHVRELVVNAAPDYASRTVTSAGGVTVIVLVRPGQPAGAIADAAVTALDRLTARLGPFPWPVLRIVQSSGGYGMEGPGIVWIPGGVAASNRAYLVTHEIVHQWFYGVVGNDQAREPFADEALTDMVARNVLGMRRGSRCPTARLDRPIYDYSAACYYETIYIGGGNLIDDARRTMGTATFYATLRRYLADHRWGLVHTRTLLDALDAATPTDLAAGWRTRFPTLY